MKKVFPPGVIAISVDVKGQHPKAICLNSDLIHGLIKHAEEFIALQGRSHHQITLDVGPAFHSFLNHKAEASGTVSVIVWAIFRHPQHGKSLFQKVSRRLRETGKAHLMWKIADDGNPAVALSDQFPKQEQFSAIMVDDKRVIQ